MREGIRQKLGLTDAELEDFGRQWNTLVLSLFGSALRDNFKPDSDVDMLVQDEPNAHWSLIDHIGFKLELESLVGRRVGLVSKPAIEKSANWILRQNTLDSADLVYESGP